MSRAPGAAAVAAHPPHHRLTIQGRALGVLRRPRQTLAAAAADGRWAGVLGWSTIVAAAASAGFYATAVGRLALVDQWDRMAAAFGRELDGAAYGRLQALGEYSAIYGVMTGVAGVALPEHRNRAWYRFATETSRWLYLLDHHFLPGPSCCPLAIAGFSRVLPHRTRECPHGLRSPGVDVTGRGAGRR